MAGEFTVRLNSEDLEGLLATRGAETLRGLEGHHWKPRIDVRRASMTIAIQSSPRIGQSADHEHKGAEALGGKSDRASF